MMQAMPQLSVTISNPSLNSGGFAMNAGLSLMQGQQQQGFAGELGLVDPMANWNLLASEPVQPSWALGLNDPTSLMVSSPAIRQVAQPTVVAPVVPIAITTERSAQRFTPTPVGQPISIPLAHVMDGSPTPPPTSRTSRAIAYAKEQAARTAALFLTSGLAAAAAQAEVIYENPFQAPAGVLTEVDPGLISNLCSLATTPQGMIGIVVIGVAGGIYLFRQKLFGPKEKQSQADEQQAGPEVPPVIISISGDQSSDMPPLQAAPPLSAALFESNFGQAAPEPEQLPVLEPPPLPEEPLQTSSGQAAPEPVPAPPPPVLAPSPAPSPVQAPPPLAAPSPVQAPPPPPLAAPSPVQAPPPPPVPASASAPVPAPASLEPLALKPATLANSRASNLGFMDAQIALLAENRRREAQQQRLAREVANNRHWASMISNADGLSLAIYLLRSDYHEEIGLTRQYPRFKEIVTALKDLNTIFANPNQMPGYRQRTDVLDKAKAALNMLEQIRSDMQGDGDGDSGQGYAATQEVHPLVAELKARIKLAEQYFYIIDKTDGVLTQLHDLLFENDMDSLTSLSNLIEYTHEHIYGLMQNISKGATVDDSVKALLMLIGDVINKIKAEEGSYLQAIQKETALYIMRLTSSLMTAQELRSGQSQNFAKPLLNKVMEDLVPSLDKIVAESAEHADTEVWYALSDLLEGSGSSIVARLINEFDQQIVQGIVRSQDGISLYNLYESLQNLEARIMKVAASMQRQNINGLRKKIDAFIKQITLMQAYLQAWHSEDIMAQTDEPLLVSGSQEVSVEAVAHEVVMDEADQLSASLQSGELDGDGDHDGGLDDPVVVSSNVGVEPDRGQDLTQVDLDAVEASVGLGLEEADPSVLGASLLSSAVSLQGSGQATSMPAPILAPPPAPVPAPAPAPIPAPPPAPVTVLSLMQEAKNLFDQIQKDHVVSTPRIFIFGVMKNFFHEYVIISESEIKKDDIKTIQKELAKYRFSDHDSAKIRDQILAKLEQVLTLLS